MLPELTKLKITTVHCKQLSTQLVTGDSREDTLVRPGSELSVTISNISTLVYSKFSLPSSTRSSFVVEDNGNS